MSLPSKTTRPDEREDLALPDLKADLVDGTQPAESLGQSGDRENLAVLRHGSGLLAEIEHRFLTRALGQLLLADAAGKQALRPQEHDKDKDQSEYQEVQPLHLVVQPDPVALRGVEESEPNRVGRIDRQVGEVGQQVEEDVVDAQGAEDDARDI